MTDQDASFADGLPSNHKKLALKADDAPGLAIISALLQDCVGKTSEIAWMPKARRFAMVVNRFRWEDPLMSTKSGDYERVRAGFHVDGVLKVRAKGFDPAAEQQVFELLDLTFEAGEDGAGTVHLTCAADAGFALEVEALDVSMADMDAVWRTDALPKHDLGEEGESA